MATWSSSSAGLGTATPGSPRGTSPTSATPRSPRSSSQVASSPPTTRTSAPGTRGATRRSPNTVTSAATPTTAVARLSSPRLRTHDTSSCGGVEPDALVPVILGSSPITTSIAAPNRNPTTTARERNCAIQPMRSAANTTKTIPETRAIPATNTATSPPTSAGRDDRAGGDGGQRGAGTGRDLAAGPEDRVEHGTGHRGVQAVLQGDPRDARVPEVLGHDQRGDRDARGDVRPQPGAVVGAQHPDDGHEVRPATTRSAGRAHDRTSRAGVRIVPTLAGVRAPPPGFEPGLHGSKGRRAAVTPGRTDAPRASWAPSLPGRRSGLTA